MYLANELKYANGKEEIIHHDRLTPVKCGMLRSELLSQLTENDDSISSDSKCDVREPINDNVDSNDSDSVPDTNDDANGNLLENNGTSRTRYPIRERRQRIIIGAIPWDAIEL